MRFNKCPLPSLHFHIQQEWCLLCPLEAKRWEAVAVMILTVKLGEARRLGEHLVRMQLAPGPPGMALCFGSICPKPDTCFCDAFC